MRALAFLLSLLFLLAPLGAAQGDGEEGEGSEGSETSSDSRSSSSGPSDEGNETDADEGDAEDGKSSGPDDGCPMPEEGPDTPEETEACRERFCRENPRAESCRGDGEDDLRGADRGPREWRRWCRAEAAEDSQRGRCRQAIAAFSADGAGHWISFEVDAANASLLDYRVDGLLVAESIHLETGSENLTVQASGAALRIGDEDTELVLHDDPTGLVRLKAADGSLTIILPADSEVQSASDGSIARVAYAGGRIGHLRADNATFLDEHTVLASGFLALLVPQGRQEEKVAEDGGSDEAKEERVTDAIEHRHVGAEITLRPARAAQAAMADGAVGNDSVEVLAYDDVEVQVQMPAGATATPDAPIRIEVSSELDEGRTIVLNVERSLLESVDPEALVLRYFDLHDQPDGSVLETEVVFRAASGLQDVLDPTDDSGSPEYWVVEDANGLQVLASVPHWSAHAITMGSLAKLAGPNVMAGLAIGIAGSLLAAGVLFWPRRPEDE